MVETTVAPVEGKARRNKTIQNRIGLIISDLRNHGYIIERNSPKERDLESVLYTHFSDLLPALPFCDECKGGA